MWPVATASAGGVGSELPPLTKPSWVRWPASSSAATGLARRQATIVAASVQPTDWAKAVPLVSACATGVDGQLPLSMIAARNSPAEPGAARCAHTDNAPADS